MIGSIVFILHIGWSGVLFAVSCYRSSVRNITDNIDVGKVIAKRKKKLFKNICFLQFFPQLILLIYEKIQEQSSFNMFLVLTNCHPQGFHKLGSYKNNVTY